MGPPRCLCRECTASPQASLRGQGGSGDMWAPANARGASALQKVRSLALVSGHRCSATFLLRHKQNPFGMRKIVPQGAISSSARGFVRFRPSCCNKKDPSGQWLTPPEPPPQPLPRAARLAGRLRATSSCKRPGPLGRLPAPLAQRLTSLPPGPRLSHQHHGSAPAGTGGAEWRAGRAS